MTQEDVDKLLRATCDFQGKSLKAPQSTATSIITPGVE